MEFDISKISRMAAVPYSRDAAVGDDLERLGHIDFMSLRDEFEGDWARTSRAHLRYLAALFPTLNLNALAQTIHDIIGNRNLIVADVRLILRGVSLNDPTRTVERIPIEAIQTVGLVLMRGDTHREAARISRVSLDTVQAIDKYLGLTERVEDQRMDVAVAAAREGLSVRKLAVILDVSKSTAHRLLERARAVLVELGEVTE